MKKIKILYLFLSLSVSLSVIDQCSAANLFLVTLNQDRYDKRVADYNTCKVCLRKDF